MKLILIGDGDQRQMYEQMAKEMDIEFKGKLSNASVREEMSMSKCDVLPSECYEGMPVSTLEGFAEGTASVVSDLGALPGLVKDTRLGEVFKTGDAKALAEAIVRLLKRKDYDEMCLACRKEAEEKYSEASNYRQLMDIYQGILK